MRAALAGFYPDEEDGSGMIGERESTLIHPDKKDSVVVDDSSVAPQQQPHTKI